MTRALTTVRGVAAGGCIALAMPPWGWWPLAFVGFALFLALIDTPSRRSRFRRGWLVGMAWLVPSTFWMVDFSLPGYFVASLLLSAYVGLAALVVPADHPTRYLAFPAAIALAEFVRTTVPFGGVPLSTVAMSQAGSPLAPISRLGGGVVLTLATVSVGVALEGLVRTRWKVSAVAVAGVALLVGLATLAPRGHDVGPLEVALAQGGGPQRTRAATSDASAVFQRHLDASAAVRPPVDLVVWPENVLAVNGELAGSQEEAKLIALAQRLGAPVVAGIVESFPGYFYNASVVITPKGDIVGRYDKVRRVPFGEYVPFRPMIDRLSGGAVSRFVPSDAVAGTGPAVIDTPTGPAGIVISWEVFFERRARDAISNGGEILLNPTNGSSYWLTIVQTQQVASSRLRALETGRWVVQAAPTGFSAFIAPDGTVHQRSAISETIVLQQQVQRRQGLTWSVRFGPWPGLALCLVLLGATWAWSRRRGAPAVAAAGHPGCTYPAASR